MSDQIITALRHSILTGVLARGSRLPTEPELADQFGAGSTTIRECLRALTSLGLVEVRHGRGAYVRNRTGDGIDGPLSMVMRLETVTLEEVRGLVEVLSLHAADLAVDVATTEDLIRVRNVAVRTAHCRTLEDVQDAVAAFLVSVSQAGHQPSPRGVTPLSHYHARSSRHVTVDRSRGLRLLESS